VNSCPYYDGSDKADARLNAMIETMNELHEHFANEMGEHGLLHEADPTVPFLELESSLYDDSESSLSLESNVVQDAPSTDLEEVFDPRLTSLPFVTPSFSSTHMNTSVSAPTLLTSPFSLA